MARYMPITTVGILGKGVALDEFPFDTEKQRTGRLAATIAQRFLEKADLIVRREGQETDFGSDFEVEFHDGASVSGRIIKCQVKGTIGPLFAQSPTHSVSIKASTQNYWAALPVNVVCLLVDLSDEAIYWHVPDATLVATQYTSLKFRKKNSVDQSAEDFTTMLMRLATSPTGSQILSQIAPSLHLFESITHLAVSTFDRGFEVDSAADGSIRAFYDHLERLCIFSGVEDLPVPWVLWERRNAVVQTIFDSNDSGYLDGNMAGEVVRYAIPYYEAALVRAEKCVRATDVEDTVPQLAELVRSGALEPDLLTEAFSAISSTGRLTLETSSRIVVGQSPDSTDLWLDGVLAEAGVNAYTLNVAPRLTS